MNLKEKTSSTSNDPKVKSALLNKYEEDSQKEIDGYERLKTKESNKLPRPTGWRLVVLPFKMKEKKNDTERPDNVVNFGQSEN